MTAEVEEEKKEEVVEEKKQEERFDAYAYSCQLVLPRNLIFLICIMISIQLILNELSMDMVQ